MDVMSSDYQKASAAPESGPSSHPTLQAFREHLKSIVRKDWEGQAFYNPEDIKRWMRDKSPSVGGQSKSHLAKLLDEVQTDRNFFRRATEDDLTRLPILFAILLDARIHHGHLISCFKRVITDDSELKLDDEHFDRLDRILTEDQDTKVPVEQLLRDFKKVRLEYCPMRIGIDNDAHLVDGAILPFCKRVPINEKGGTANVEQYMIQTDLVADDLRSALEGSRQTVPDFGECYSIAVKSYNFDETAAYQLEVDAFKALDHISGVIKCFGEYNRRLDKGPLAHHIILEFGEHDLDEYLAANFPPILYKETIGFWKSIFKVTGTLERLHEAQYGPIPLSGWHGDIKPDNILRVKDEFKLADFGFTQFKVRSPGAQDPKTQLQGLTKSFGAPEIRTSGQNGGYSQKIDTWSFGCVLSSVATWVILGQQAYDHYPEIRKVAIQNLKEQRKSDKSIHAPDANDAFHDGVNVLPAVLQWHDLLRNSIRKSDSISGRVISLIEEGMLVGDIQKRWTVQKTHRKLLEALSLAEADHQAALESADHPHALKRLSPHMLKVLLNLDKAAPVTPTTAGEARSTSSARQGLGTGRATPLSADNQGPRVRKSERLDKNVRAKVAFREQAIMSELKKNETSIPEEAQEDGQQGFASARINPVSEEGKGKQPPTPSIQITNPVIAPQPPSQRGRAPSFPHHEQSTWPTIPDIHEQYQPEKIPLSPSTTEVPHGNPKPPPLSMKRSSRTLSGMSASPAIHLDYEKLEKEYSKLSVKFGFKRPPKDPKLQKYIHNRDIKFVVDNASTMSGNWWTVDRVLLALAMKIGQLDEDGIDLVYTIGEHRNLNNIKKGDIYKSFKPSLEQAGTTISDYDKTNMSKTLGTIFSEYLKDTSKRMTLIILTDGLWEGSRTEDDVELLIAKFVKELQEQRRSMEQRWFSIQFVYFGEEDTPAISRLKSLDDNMKERFRIEDIIDSKPWFHEPTDELILGSIEEGVDEEDTVTESGREGSSRLSPPPGHSFTGLHRQPSSGSSRGSIGHKKRFSLLPR